MTRSQIVEMTTETDRQISANETGIAPVQEKHTKRFAELKRQHQYLEEDIAKYGRFAKRA